MAEKDQGVDTVSPQATMAIDDLRGVTFKTKRDAVQFFARWAAGAGFHRTPDDDDLHCPFRNGEVVFDTGTGSVFLRSLVPRSSLRIGQVNANLTFDEYGMPSGCGLGQSFLVRMGFYPAHGQERRVDYPGFFSQALIEKLQSMEPLPSLSRMFKPEPDNGGPENG